MSTMTRPAPVIHRSPGWEDRLLDALRAGPIRVACHKDPRPRLRRLSRYVLPGYGHRISPRVRLLLAATLQQARAEGLTWRELTDLLGLRPDQLHLVRYYAGERGGPHLRPVN